MTIPTITMTATAAGVPMFFFINLPFWLRFPRRLCGEPSILRERSPWADHATARPLVEGRAVISIVLRLGAAEQVVGHAGVAKEADVSVGIADLCAGRMPRAAVPLRLRNGARIGRPRAVVLVCVCYPANQALVPRVVRIGGAG